MLASPLARNLLLSSSFCLPFFLFLHFVLHFLRRRLLVLCLLRLKRFPLRDLSISILFASHLSHLYCPLLPPLSRSLSISVLTSDPSSAFCPPRPIPTFYLSYPPSGPPGCEHASPSSTGSGRGDGPLWEASPFVLCPAHPASASASARFRNRQRRRLPTPHSSPLPLPAFATSDDPPITELNGFTPISRGIAMRTGSYVFFAFCPMRAARLHI
ncbi:hypothetical protein CDD83_459 [Cordyceps sp. RAO-2017]|nr:hypothetical protein CDD83_459 [Cordyceps sp. RAO-2017]